MSDAQALLAKLGGSNKKKAKGAPTSAGRHPAKYKIYYAQRYAVNKLRRILRRNGRKAAQLWAEAHGALMVLHNLGGK